MKKPPWKKAAFSPVVRVIRPQPEPATLKSEIIGPAVNGLVQLFGLDIRAAALVIGVDLLLLGLDAVSFGTFVLVGCVIATVLASAVYQIQRKLFGDDHTHARIKAAIVGLLTAIPIPITPVIVMACGIMGALRSAFSLKNRS